MSSKKSLLPVEFGVFTKLSPQRIEIIRIGSEELVEAYRAGDAEKWQAVIYKANSMLTKHERGFFSALAHQLRQELGATQNG